MRIRPVEPRDAARTAEIPSAIITTGVETSMSERLRIEDQAKYIVGFPARGVFLVADVPTSNLIVGMQSIEPCGDASDANGHVAEISTFVDAAVRRSGVASALMEAMCIEATKKGFRKLTATIRADSAVALRFYARCGFREVGNLREQLHFRDNDIDLVIAEHVLGALASRR